MPPTEPPIVIDLVNVDKSVVEFKRVNRINNFELRVIAFRAVVLILEAQVYNLLPEVFPSTL